MFNADELQRGFSKAEKALDAILLLMAEAPENVKKTIIPIGLEALLMWLRDLECGTPQKFMDKAARVIGYDRAKAFSDKVSQAVNLIVNNKLTVTRIPMNPDGSVPDEETARQSLVDQGVISPDQKYEIEISALTCEIPGRPAPRPISQCHPEFGNLLDPDEVEKELKGK